MQDVLAVIVAIAIVLVGVVLVVRDAPPAASTTAPDSGTTSSLVVITGQGAADEVIARSLGGTVLTLPGPSEVPPGIKRKLRALTPAHDVLILGGEKNVAAAAHAQLQAATAAPVTRIAGPDRYATAARVASTMFAQPVRRVLVTTAELPPPALEQARVFIAGNPVLLTTSDSVPATTSAVLRQLRPRHVVVLGDRTVVSDAVLSELRKHTPGDVFRLPVRPSAR